MCKLVRDHKSLQKGQIKRYSRPLEIMGMQANRCLPCFQKDIHPVAPSAVYPVVKAGTFCSSSSSSSTLSQDHSLQGVVCLLHTPTPELLEA